MKTSIKILIISLVLFACNEKKYTITTKINRDGSCERTMVMTGDSSSYEDEIFKIKIDTSWEQHISWELDTVDNEYKCTVEATKKYESVDQMSQEFAVSCDTIKGRKATHITFHKKFRWFYTYFNYKEIYPKTFKSDYYPITNYLTDEEIRAYLWKETDSLYFEGMDTIQVKLEEERLDSLVGEFYTDNIFESTKRALLQILESDYALKLQNDSVSYFLKRTYFEDLFADSSESFDRVFDSIFHPLSIEELHDSNEELFAEVDLMDDTGNGGKYSNRLILPGKLINTNANEVDSVMVSWLVGDKNDYIDYPMWAKSRVVNYWAWIVSGGVLLLAFILLLIPSRKR